MTAVKSTHACPVCDERHETAVPRCFRCQTTLIGWWNLESALTAATEGGTVPAAADAPARGYERVVAVTATVVATLLLGFILTRLLPGPAPTSDAPVVSAQSASAPVAVVPLQTPTAAAPPPARIVLYHVQRRDTLWRIAAALTGDGRNWTRLWPDRITRPATLQAGTTLRVPVDD